MRRWDGSSVSQFSAWGSGKSFRLATIHTVCTVRFSELTYSVGDVETFLLPYWKNEPVPPCIVPGQLLSSMSGCEPVDSDALVTAGRQERRGDSFLEQWFV